MTISDAIPVQFWLTGDTTFNESNPICGLTDVCFCQPFNASDELVFQFSDTNNFAYSLIIYNSDNEEIDQLTFESTQVGDHYIYSLSFIPSEIGITSDKIRFEIIYNQNSITTELTALTPVVDGEIVTGDNVVSAFVSMVTDPEIDPCDGDLLTAYWDGIPGVPFTTGETLYTDAGLTTPLTGYDWVLQLSGYDLDGDVREINTANGVVGITTGFICSS